jgi:hypothetical protein
MRLPIGVFLSIVMFGCGGGESITTESEVDFDQDGFLAEDDCDDSNQDINPGALEICDGTDNDCDGLIDDADPGIDLTNANTFYVDADTDGYGDPEAVVLACVQPSHAVLSNTDCDDTDAAQHPDANEYCNGEDDDCDADVDEDDALDASTWYLDHDADGYGDVTYVEMSCDQPSGYVADSSDCNDLDSLQYPGADEYCNGEDDDCDAVVDEDDAVDVVTWFLDSDNDGFGDATIANTTCYQPSGYIADSSDCDDADNTQYPGADEYCNGEDDNCDAVVDEDDALDASTWYQDGDSDGYGDLTTANTTCYQPSGYIADNSDCDDADNTQYPGADEYCNGEDDNCDTVVDEDDALDASTWYQDGDSDGYGDGTTANTTCYQPSGYVADSSDCDDADNTQYPGADEYCNGEDDNCDTVVDEDDALDASTWYQDGDSDGYGDGTTANTTCYQPSGYVADNSDCDDTEDSVYPGAAELCDGLDNDCLPATGEYQTISLNQSNYLSIQSALDAALPSETIAICNGTFTEDLTVSNDVTLRSLNGAEYTTIQGSGASAVILVESGFTLEGVTVTGGTGFDLSGQLLGGGIYAWEAEGNLNIIDSIIENNTAEFGGGLIGPQLHSLTLTGSVIRDNSVTISGGGLYVYGPAALTGTVIESNVAEYGGGLYADEAVLTIDGTSVIRSNAAISSGGGLRTGNALSVTLAADTEVSFNQAEYGAGGYLYSDGTITSELIGGNFNNNEATTSGGGLYVYGPASLTGTVIESNAAEYGGGLYADEAVLTIDGGNFNSNEATSWGGGLYILESDCVVALSDITSNTATNGGGLYIYESDCEVALSDITSNTATYGGGLLLWSWSGNFVSTVTNWGSGADDNTPNDVELYGGVTYTGLGSGLSFECDTSYCY